MICYETAIVEKKIMVIFKEISITTETDF